jgi:hypothetical protein
MFSVNDYDFRSILFAFIPSMWLRYLTVNVYSITSFKILDTLYNRQLFPVCGLSYPICITFRTSSFCSIFKLLKNVLIRINLNKVKQNFFILF